MSLFTSNLSTRQLVNFRKLNSQTENQKGVNSVPINALLACKRCSLRPLLTPFWSLIKHLLVCNFVTYWFSVSCRVTFLLAFLVTLKGDWARICNDFSESNSVFSYHYCTVIATTNFTNYANDFYPLNIEVWTLNSFTFEVWTPLPLNFEHWTLWYVPLMTTNFSNYTNPYC